MKKFHLILGLVLYFLYIPLAVCAIIIIFNLLPENTFFTLVREFAKSSFGTLGNWIVKQEESFPVGVLAVLIPIVIIIVGFLYTTILTFLFHLKSINKSLDQAIDSYETPTYGYDTEYWSISSSGDVSHHGGTTEEHSGAELGFFIFVCLLRIIFTPLTFPIEAIMKLKKLEDYD